MLECYCLQTMFILCLVFQLFRIIYFYLITKAFSIYSSIMYARMHACYSVEIYFSKQVLILTLCHKIILKGFAIFLGGNLF